MSERPYDGMPPDPWRVDPWPDDPQPGDNYETRILARDYRDYCERQHDDASRLAHTSDEPLWYSALVWEARARAMDTFLAWLDADDDG